MEHDKLGVGFGRYGHLAPSLAIKNTACTRFENSSPLLEEKRNARALTSVANLSNPFWVEFPRAGPRFSTNDHPINSTQRKPVQWTQQWFNAQKLDTRLCSSWMIYAVKIILVFDAYAHPRLRLPSNRGIYEQQPLGAFRQNLVLMPARAPHDIKHAMYVLDGNCLMKQVAHAIDEDTTWLSPMQWMLQHVRLQR
jgi:hypothetical protein